MTNPAVIAGATVGAVLLLDDDPMHFSFGKPSPVPGSGSAGAVPPRVGSDNRERPNAIDPSRAQLEAAAKEFASKQWSSMTTSAKQSVINDLSNRYPAAAAALKTVKLNELKSFNGVVKTLGAVGGSTAGIAACSATGVGAAAAPLCGAAGAFVTSITLKPATAVVKTAIKAPVQVVKHPISTAKTVVSAPVKIITKPKKTVKKIGKAVKKLKFW